MGIVRRQAAYSGIITIIGFAIGAVNIILLFPWVMSKEQFGLTKVMMDGAATVAGFCSMGIAGILIKFSPYYHQYQHSKKNDLAGLSLIVCVAGFLVFLFIAFFFKDFIIRKLGGKSPLFVPYYWLMIPTTLFYLLFIWLEAIAWGFKRAVLTNSLRETFIRVYTSILLGLFAFGAFTFDGFMMAYSFSFSIPVIIIWVILKKKEGFGLDFTPGKLTYRFRHVIYRFMGYAISGQVLGILIKNMDTFFLAGFSKDGLGDVAIFTIATYITMIMEIPFRSVVSTASPILAESWKNKDMKNILHIYSKSTLNLLVMGFFLFGCIWINLHNLPHIFPKEYKIESTVILVLAITKLIDLGTGLNAHVIATSLYWKFEFYTTIVLSILALFINGYLVKHFGIVGAAWGTLLTLTMHNFTRFIFLWVKFGLQPFSLKNLMLLAVAAVSILVFLYFPKINSWVIDGFVRCIAFSVLYFGLIWVLHISEDIKIMTRSVLRRFHIIK